MKQTFASLLLALLVISGASSCRKEPGNPTSIQAKLKEYRNGDEFIQFAYAADGKVRQVKLQSDLNTNGTEVDYAVTYRADGKIAALNAAGGDRIEAVYDNGRLQRADRLTNNVRTGYTSYLYEPNGDLKGATVYFGIGADVEPFLAFDFRHDARGNVQESTFFVATGVAGQLRRAGHAALQYDAAPNPLFPYRDLLALFWQPASRNNLLQEQQYDEQLQLEDVFQYTYTYQANGLPQNGTVRSGRPGTPPTTSNILFVYQ